MAIVFPFFPTPNCPFLLGQRIVYLFYGLKLLAGFIHTINPKSKGKISILRPRIQGFWPSYPVYAMD